MLTKKLETHCFTAATVEEAVLQANNLTINGRKFEDSHIFRNPKGVTFVIVLENFGCSDKSADK